MSAKALEELKKMWKDLVFARVSRIIEGENGHYFGFTDEGIYLARNSQCGLDFDVDLTCNFSNWLNHQRGDKPNKGKVVAGIVEETAKGKRFKRWFPASEGWEMFNRCVRLPEPWLIESTKRELESRYAGAYWGVFRLVFFDDVQAFVDAYKGAGFGMLLPMGAAYFVHLLSHTLREPAWWADFYRLAEEQGVAQTHGAFWREPDKCEDCIRISDPDRWLSLRD